MTEREQESFLLGCAIGFDLEFQEVDAILKDRGLSVEGSSLMDCQLALRAHVGEDRWKNGIRIIQNRTREDHAESN